ncbi:hypothetical protein R3P38DRAFT_3292277 [Favolaschia claudopus]|uniref:DEAD/DEAH-box helicase domain-containing protein n=1 Tax=Favolaschia claudopus TaxID=2862362 RepID=A0AAV9ZL16_9AGAR
MDSSPPIQVVSQPETPAQWMERVLSARCKLTRLRPFQLDLALEIDNKKNVFCVIATGMGKTVVLMAGAMAASARSEKGIALLIVPTKVLVEQQAEVASRLDSLIPVTFSTRRWLMTIDQTAGGKETGR